MSALRALWTALSALQWDRAPSSVGCDVPRGRGLAQLGTERAAEQPAARAPLTSHRGSWGTQVCVSRWEASARLAHWSDHPPQTRNSDFWSYTIPLHPNLCSPLIFLQMQNLFYSGFGTFFLVHTQLIPRIAGSMLPASASFPYPRFMRDPLALWFELDATDCRPHFQLCFRTPSPCPLIGLKALLPHGEIYF